MSWKDEFPKENIYFETENGILYCNDIVKQLKLIPDNSIDLVITSPPYGSLRYYGSKNQKEFENIWNFEKFKQTAKELYRILKKGGVVVWVVDDTTIKGSETGNSFRQALFFKDVCGFNLYDTMIYAKQSFVNPDATRYWNIFEYMFIFSKEKPKTINLIEDRKNKNYGKKHNRTYKRQKDKKVVQEKKFYINEYGKRTNIWGYFTGNMHSTKDKIAFQHPAIFPERLAYDHIISWSNEGDIVLDCFMGSGTTAKQCKILNRKWIGIEINADYCKITKQRLLRLLI